MPVVAGTMTLGNAISAVRDLIDESSPQFWTNAQITNWLNQGCADIARRAMVLRNQVQVAVFPNIQNYSGPTDMYELYRVEFVPSTGTFTYPLTWMGWQESDQAWGTYQSFPAAWPEIYTTWWNPGSTTTSPSNLQLRLFPVPAQSGVLNVFYYRQVVPAVADTDQLDTIPGWEDLAVEYAIYLCKRKDKEPDWQDAFSFYEQKLNDMIQITGTFQDQAGTFSTGQGQWPPWAIGSYGGSDW